MLLYLVQNLKIIKILHFLLSLKKDKDFKGESSLMLNTTRKYERSIFKNKKKFAHICDFFKIILFFE